MTAFYNEIDPYAAQWLRNLIDAGHIASGVVDERSIVDLDPDEIRGFTQCHFFAGIGVWSHALRLAGWPDSRPVWTGSCPCQPFSAAGAQRGSEDERHLWSAFFRLIRECRPRIVFGEQVAGSAGYAWWDHVAADLEGEGYAAAAADIGAHSVGAPHLRQRLYWMADAGGSRARGDARATDCATGTKPGARDCHREHGANGAIAGCAIRLMADPADVRRGQPRDARELHGEDGSQSKHGQEDRAIGSRNLGADDHWADLEWLACRDGKARPTQPGLFPLAHGAPSRVGRLRAYGNAIVAPLAAEFIRAAMSVEP